MCSAIMAPVFRVCVSHAPHRFRFFLQDTCSFAIIEDIVLSKGNSVNVIELPVSVPYVVAR